MGVFNHRADRYARPVAEMIGVAADDVVVRYGVMTLSFLFLLAAAYVFGPAAQLQAIAVLLVALGLIVFIIYWWFLEEARKRRVMLLEEQPLPHDSHNPDLRDEVVFACVFLLIVTAMLLQTLNDTSLHYKVDDAIGLKALACSTAGTAFCSDYERLIELPEWMLFTLSSFVTTVPMADQVPEITGNMSGISPTADTPHYVTTSLRFMLGGVFFTLVIGSFRKVGRQIDAAIEALARTHTVAAGMGPIIIDRLKHVLDDATQEARWNNCLLALSDIAEHYKGSRTEIDALLVDCLASKFSSIGLHTKKQVELARLQALTTVFCVTKSDRGLQLLFDHINVPTGLVHIKVKLVRIVADKLERDIAIQFLQELDPASMKKTLAKAVGNALADLDDAAAEADGDAPPPPRQGSLPLS